MTETTHIKDQFNVKLNGGGVTETTLFTLIKCHPYSGFSLIFSNKQSYGYGSEQCVRSHTLMNTTTVACVKYEYNRVDTTMLWSVLCF